MNWADALPNLLIGLREGLEGGLVVTILLAAIRRADAPSSARTALWWGVAGAVSLSASFAAALTFSSAALSGTAQDALAGSLSVLAVVLVTIMVFWMRRSAAGLSAQLRGDVARAVTIGSGALILTGFFAVGREGLETTLFLWTAVKASGTTLTPIVGGALGLTLAVVGCVLLYRQALRINLGLFFNRTAILLIVIAAGVLSYGIGDLQTAGIIPGRTWVAFDLSGHLDPNSWWMSLISGLTALRPTMTVLQASAWVGYLVVTIWAFLRAGRTVSADAATAVRGAEEQRRSSRVMAWAADHRSTTAGVLIGLPVIVAAGVIAALPSEAAGAQAVSVKDGSCAPEWTSGSTGTTTFEVHNASSRAGEIILATSSGAIAGEIETLAPATTMPITASLGAGTYHFECRMAGAPSTGPDVTVSGTATAATAAIAPVTVEDLTGPNNRYRAYVATTLRKLAADVDRLRADIAAGDRPAARRDWLTAQMTWETVGASYNSFGDDGVAVDGIAAGLPLGVHDADFVGLHRVEYGLFHNEAMAALTAPAARLAADVAVLRAHLDTDDVAGDPTSLPLRVHEILEDALRDHLAGIDDNGAGAAYAMTSADVSATRVVLADLAALVEARKPGLVDALTRQLDAIDHALAPLHRADGTWTSLSAATLAQRQAVNGAVGLYLETAAQVPDLLETPPTF